ncbi:GntR family transcriptional regulator [Jiangella alkaliphila]|uniref:DNA-binding transcriptional regulator YhcF, GntR family n=1 Tax=Jiangella alkaliphila TaxID=419479 RepID=A0A1H2IRM8_9ACTN|nr:GntR family transcriptional regulator [Jiangella alkaliphila]SDU46799.1 DNA-binding transcriptional regulator YhcF, GntR family [Jiangella alkaliphila]
MVDKIQVSLYSDVPIYRQIVTQLSFMIETGDLGPGQALPSARLLADNLHINRNTVARAYAELGEIGLVEGRGRSGTIVVGPGPEREGSLARDQARQVLEAATRECIELGLSAAEIQSLVMSLALRAEDDLLKVSFVECNVDRAKYFANELEDKIGVKVKPLVIGTFEPEEERADLVLTTFFHLAEVRGLMRQPKTEVVAIVVAPHVQTLVQIASVAKNGTVGIWYRTDEQAITVRDSLRDSGIKNIEVLDGIEDKDLEGVDLVVIPDEMTDLEAQLDGKVEVMRFGNVLDAASIRMVSDVVRDMQQLKRGTAPSPGQAPAAGVPTPVHTA